jgi:endonuclease-3
LKTKKHKTAKRVRLTTPDERKKIQQLLKRMYPDVECALTHETPLQLLISTILSAQCTDVRVNKVTPGLFKTFRTAKDFGQAPIEQIEELIRSTGFFRAKAKSIQSAARDIYEKHGGRVPQTMSELIKLRGVGRKTANVVLGEAFGKAEGVVVDTHVKRLTHRMGFTREKDPVKIEKDLIRIIPKKDWPIFSHRLIWHGRSVCKAIKPRCPECKIAPLCPSAEF